MREGFFGTVCAVRSEARAGWVTVQYGGLNDKQQSGRVPSHI